MPSAEQMCIAAERVVLSPVCMLEEDRDVR